MKSSLIWLFRGIGKPGFLMKWVKVHLQIMRLQLRYLFDFQYPNWSIYTYIKSQITIHDLLWNLELHHRMDRAFGDEGYLPHVDAIQEQAKSERYMEALRVPKSLDLVLIGAGHAHAYVIKKLGMEPVPGLRVTIISDQADTPYSGMLPGEIAGEYSREESHIDIRNLSQFAGAIFIQAVATKIDREMKLVYTDSDCPPLRYDILSIDIGSSPKMLGSSSVKEASIAITPVKPISQFSLIFDNFLRKVSSRREKAIVGVVGAGAGGIDLIIALHSRFVSMNICAVLILFSCKGVLPTHNIKGQQLVQNVLKRKGVKILTDFKVTKVVGKEVFGESGASIEVTDLFWCTHATCHSLLQESGFACDSEGFIKVNSTLETIDTPNVFAAGDCCHIVGDPCPKAGVFAVREGPILSENIRKVVSRLHKNVDEKLTNYVPQRTFLGIIGKHDACIATKGEMAIQGSWLWNLKQWIDMKWMKSYNELPVMASSPVSTSSQFEELVAKAKMRCGGCGSKIGSTILSRALQKAGITTDALDDCSILSLPSGDYEIVQSIDFFREMVKDPFLFGKIAAVHSLSDVHAMGGKAISAQAVCVVPFANHRIVENDLVQLLTGAISTLKHENCQLQGGHSTEGEVLSMGLHVTGICPKGRVLKKSGAQVGDQLILTKPLGTGIILAALMKQQAKCSWVDGTISSMKTSNFEAGQLLLEYATSCTDVTGFGLAGHLLEILRASQTKASVSLNAVPIFPGVKECIAKNIESSIYGDNAQASNLIDRNSNIEEGIYKVLFDPQTAGGLLASVPSGRASEVLLLLKEKGYTKATIIGEVISMEELETDSLFRVV